MKHIALIAASMLIAGQANALSCLRPDPARTFQAAADSTDTYVVLRGSLSFDEKLMPEFDGMSWPGELPTVPALFQGMALGPDGFTIRYQTELLLQPSCAGPWCGGMYPSDDAIAFARDNGAGVYVIDLGPCPMWVYDTPDAVVVGTITQCMSGGLCSPAN